MTSDSLEIEDAGNNPVSSRSAIRRFGAALAAIVLMVVYFLDFPQLSNNPARMSLDNSWAMAYHYFSTHGALAGVDYKFTYGPLYFFLAKLYDPDLYSIHLAARIAVAAAAAVVFTAALFRARAATLKVALGLTLFLALPQSGTDTPAFLLLAVETAWLISAVQPSRFEIGAFAVLCGALALSKFTLFLLGCTSIGAIALAVFFHGRRRAESLLAPALFCATLTVLWFAAGQGANFVDFVAGALQISQAYAQTMGTEVIAWTVPYGAVTVALGLLCMVLRLVHRREPRDLLLVLYALALVVLSWKLGFNRPSTGHTRLLFAMNIVAVLILLEGTRPREAAVRWVVSVAAVGVAATSWFSLRATPTQTAVEVLDRPFAYMASVAQAYLSPEATRTDHDFRYQSLRRLYALPIIKQVVGAATVDMYPPAQASILLNDLNYHPRPVFQGYQAGTLGLLEENGAFYRSARAPEYVIFEIGALDGRYPGVEDSQALIALMTHYEYRAIELPYLLLKRKAEPVAIALHSTQTFAARWNEWHDAPADDDWTLASIEARHSPLGTLRGRLLRPAQYSIEVELSDGAVVKHRMNGCAALPFIFQPYLEAGLEIMGHSPGLPTRRVVRFRFVVDAGFETQFEDEIPVRFDRIAPLR